MANLYDKASLVLPSSPAYKAGVIQAYKPLTDGGTFDFTRATSANRINSDNLIESVGNNVPRMDYTDGSCPSLLLEPQSTNLINYPVSFGNSYWSKSGASIKPDPSTAGAEQVANGNFATDSAWLKEAGWTISGGTANCVNGQGISIYQTNVVDIGKQYKLTFSISNYSQGYLGSLGNDFGGVVAEGDGSYEIYGTATSASFGFSAFGNFIGSVDNVSVKEVQGFSSPSADSPTSAFKLVEGTATSGHSVYRIQGGLSSGADYTQSFFVKASERYKVKIKDAADGTYFGAYNLTTGVLIDEGSNSIGGTTIEALSNGWYRLTLLSNQATAVRYPQINLLPNDYVAGDSNSYTGDGTSGVYLFGAQLEQQSYPTSFIYNGTEGSSVTRVAETCGGAGDSTVFNSTEGVLYWNSITEDNNATSKSLSISNGGNTLLSIYYYGSSVNVVLNVNGVNQFYANTGITIGQEYKFAALYQLNNFALYVNGVKVVSSTSGIVPSPNTFDRLSFNEAAINNFYGNVKQVITFNTALLDSELAALTTL